MKNQLLLSAMKEQNIKPEDIQEYAREKKAWLKQEEMVKSGVEGYVSYPHPIHHPWIVSAVDEKGEIVCGVTDDTKEVEAIEKLRTFEDKKSGLIVFIANKEKEEKLKILPSGKERLMNLHIERIMTADPNVVRSKDDEDFMSEVDNMKKTLKKIDWWAAEQLSEIADLTEENIDSWKPTLMKV